MSRRVSVLLAAAAAALALAGLGSAGGVPTWKSWLCYPNHMNDWCYVQLPTVIVKSSGSPKAVNVNVPSSPPVDCFYVYPTVSTENRPNADLRLQTEERNAAIIQAARFSQVCRVFAPLYRQTTASSNDNGDANLAYSDVLAAWKDYLAHANHGRGVVLLGHSQGSFVLERLIREQIDPNPAERKLLVSALLLGGDVTVADGKTTGGSFEHVPACTSPTETGCVVAYSSWDRTPPADAELLGVDHAGEHVLCTNPAALGGGSGPITPIFTKLSGEGIVPSTSPYLRYLWTEFPGLYTARCVQQGNRSWLLVTRIHHEGDIRPTVQEVLGPQMGLHAADVNIALGTLVSLVGSQARAWLAKR